jgi:Ca2+-binding RTX toxin-like protein
VFTASTPDNWTVDAKAGNDTITTLGGADTVFAGGGNDIVSTAGGNDTIYFTGAGGGFDAVDGGEGNDTILANANNTVIGLSALAGVEAISSSGFSAVRILGTAAGDSLDFSATTLTGITEINGGAGNDTLIGSAGADTIVGGAGQDTLTGGGGADTFVFKAVGESTLANSDRILDFVSGLDRIDLSAIDAHATLAGNQAFTFIGTDEFTGLGQVRVGMSGGQVILSGNTTGNLAADFMIRLDSNPLLTIGDFVL